MGVNTVSSGHSSHSFGKTLNVLLSKGLESCGVLQMEGQGKRPAFHFAPRPPTKSIPGSAVVFVDPKVIGNHSPQLGTRERFTTELFKFCWGKIHNDFFPPPLSPSSLPPHLPSLRTPMIHGSFACPPGGPKRHRQGAWDPEAPNQASWDQGL